MKLLVAEFGTHHYYQADGLFSNRNGPWLADANAEGHAGGHGSGGRGRSAGVGVVSGGGGGSKGTGKGKGNAPGKGKGTRPACVYADPAPNTYIAVCAGGGYNCNKHATLAAAEAACSVREARGKIKGGGRLPWLRQLAYTYRGPA